MPKMKIDGPDSKTRIIKAARKLFFKHGVSAVSNEMLAKEARVSMGTLYTHIGDRKAIMKVVLDEENKKYFEPEFTMPETKEVYRQAMIEFGLSLLNLINKPELRKFDQLMLSQVIKHPDMTRFFFDHAYEMTYKHLEVMIQAGQDAGYITRTEDAALLSDILLNGWEGRTYQRALYGFKGSNHEDRENYLSTIMKIVLEL